MQGSRDAKHNLGNVRAIDFNEMQLKAVASFTFEGGIVERAGATFATKTKLSLGQLRWTPFSSQIPIRSRATSLQQTRRPMACRFT